MYIHSYPYSVCVNHGDGSVYLLSITHMHLAMCYTHAFSSVLPFPLQCTHSVGLSTYYYQLNNPPTKVGWLGSGCSSATIPTAELTQYYNITQVICTIVSSLVTVLLHISQVSCVSSSPDLKDRERFR